MSRYHPAECFLPQLRRGRRSPSAPIASKPSDAGQNRRVGGFDRGGVSRQNGLILIGGNGVEVGGDEFRGIDAAAGQLRIGHVSEVDVQCANRCVAVGGDCTKVLRRMPDNSVDMVLTDPPYLVRYMDRNGRSIANDDNGRWIFLAFAEIDRVMKPDSYCVSFYGWSKLSRFLTAWREIGFRPFGHFVWVKRYASCSRHTKMKHEQAYLLAKGNPPPPKDPPSDVRCRAQAANPRPDLRH